MDWVKFCQWYLFCALIVRFLIGVWVDFNGRDAIKPLGFGGFLGSVFMAGVSATLLYTAGAFSVIFRSSP